MQGTLNLFRNLIDMSPVQKKWRLPGPLLLLPSYLLLGLFVVYPQLQVFRMAFFDWVPGQQLRFIGLQNFFDLVSDPLFASSFELVGVLLLSNLFKMWPAIFAAIVLHRLASERWRSIYQGLFMVPFVIPTLVWLLLWKSFYDPTYGILNRFLQVSGLMEFLHWLDGSPGEPGILPSIAAFLERGLHLSVIPLLGSVWAIVMAGVMVIRLGQHRDRPAVRYRRYILLLQATLFPAAFPLLPDPVHPGVLVLWLLGLLVVAMIFNRHFGKEWFGWAILFVAGTILFQGALWRLPLLFLLVFLFHEILLYQYHSYRVRTLQQRIGAVLLAGGGLLILLTKIWTEPTGEFAAAQPAWLGNELLVVPAIILWGFPWVGTIGVLIYLAGLQRIPRSVYEAARMEGVGSFGLIWHVELPMILTQIRINLVFMTLATLTQYEFFLLLLGVDGGPGNRGLVPGLHMFREAFEGARFGYASAIGVVLFFAILALTLTYNRYLRSSR